MNILVLGGTNFIGAHAVRRLASLGHEVTVFHRGKTEAELPENVEHIYGDKKRLREYREEFQKLEPEVILDTFAMTEEDAKAVVEVFQGLTKRLVVLSSGDVYRAYSRLIKHDPGPSDPVPLTEDSPLRDKLYPYREYAESSEDFEYTYDKVLVERVVMTQPDTLPATVLRLPMVFGPSDYQHRLFSYLKRMDDGRPFILLAEDWARARALRGYVEDMAEAIALCVTKQEAANRVYHVAYRENFIEEAWLRMVADTVGWKGDIVKVPNEELPEGLQHHMDMRQDWSVDSGRIRAELGYEEVVPLREALRRTVTWEREHPPEEVDAAKFDYAAEDEVVARRHGEVESGGKL